MSRIVPGVEVLEERPAVRAIDVEQLTICGFLGVAEMGPVGEVVELTSFEGYRRIFGGFLAGHELALAVHSFFEEGGSRVKVVRTVHYTDVLDPSSKTSAAAELELDTAVAAPSSAVLDGTEAGPFNIPPGSSLVVDVDGDGDQTATVNAAAATKLSGNTEPFSLTSGQTLVVSINGVVQPSFEFLEAEFPVSDPITAALAVDVIDVINAKLTGQQTTAESGAVRISTDRKGTGASLEIVGGTAAAAFGFPGAVATGSGNVADSTVVTPAEIETIVEAAMTAPQIAVVQLSGSRIGLRSPTTGASSTIQVSSGVLQGLLGFSLATVSGSAGAAAPTLGVFGRHDGAYANALSIRVAAARSGEADRFDLQVLRSGVAISGETFADVSMDVADARYVETVVNASPEAGGSRLVRVEDLELAAVNRLPGAGTFGPLTGGDDGLAGLADTDFVGNRSDLGGTGLRLFDTHRDVNLLVVPGQATAVVQVASVQYCEFTRRGDLFAVLDCPAAQTAASVVAYVTTTAQLRGLSEYAGIYWPRLRVVNPDKNVFGAVDTILVSPAGRVAGVMARTDARDGGGFGIYQPPAGVTYGSFRGVVGLETDEVQHEDRRGLVMQAQINPIRLPDRGGGRAFIDGSLVLRRDAIFDRVHKRRGVIFIETSIQRGLELVVHLPNTPKLRRQVEAMIRRFLDEQLKQNAFASEDPAQAYSIDVSERLNSPAVVAAKRLLTKIGLAMTNPAEFITIIVSADERALELERALAA